MIDCGTDIEMIDNFYKIIGCGPAATAEEIENACIRLGQRYGASKYPNDPTAKKQFETIEGAYETLGDPEKRARYDMLLFLDEVRQQAPDSARMAGKPFTDVEEQAFLAFSRFMQAALTGTKLSGLDERQQIKLCLFVAGTLDNAWQTYVPCDKSRSGPRYLAILVNYLSILVKINRECLGGFVYQMDELMASEVGKQIIMIGWNAFEGFKKGMAEIPLTAMRILLAG